jgi:isocitrate lyase
MRNCKRRSSRPKSMDTATKHQHEVGTGYFDDVAQVIAVGLSSTTALRGSTEHKQFH